MEFRWHPDEPPPAVEEHSKAKLKVLRSYLHAYFNRLNVDLRREEFKLDLVDGFAGGGEFSDDGQIVSGTPLIMLEEAAAAESRLNRGRIKKLRFDCKFYFIDIQRPHTDYLEETLSERKYCVDGENIVVVNGAFEDAIDRILHRIRQRQPKAGRAIFLLDQTGYTHVGIGLVARIFRYLPAAEVILTIAADALVNHLPKKEESIGAIAALNLPESRVRELVSQEGGDGRRALAQRTLIPHLRTESGATYDTPFFLRPKGSRRALWFLHLSRHPVARDVMLQQHWNTHNTFLHYGQVDIGMLGWDALRSDTLPMFHFEALDIGRLHDQLMDSMLNELYPLASERPISIDTIRHVLANKTAARFSDLDNVILKLVKEKELDILTSEGKERSRTLTQVKASDLIVQPRTLLLPTLSRRQR